MSCDLIPAVTHVDGSARVQTVDPQRNPDFARLLSAFEELTGCPILVNTSFNVRGEPIVCTPQDAYRCFMRTDIDLLVIEDRLLWKSEQPAWKRPFTGGFCMNLIDAVPAPAENGEATTLAHVLFDEVIAPASAEEKPSYFAPADEPDRATYFLQPSPPQLTPTDFEFPGGGEADGLVEALVEHWTKQGETRLATSGQRLKEIIAALRAEGVETDGDVDPYCYTMF